MEIKNNDSTVNQDIFTTKFKSTRTFVSYRLTDIRPGVKGIYRLAQNLKARDFVNEVSSFPSNEN